MATVMCTECKEYYDDEMYDRCPNCDGEPITELVSINEKKPVVEDVTVAWIDESAQQEIDSEDAVNDALSKKLAGWLVCTKGSQIGKDYRLYDGWNRIGRSSSMAVNIEGDSRVSRENHLSVIFDDLNGDYYIKNENGTNSTLNGEQIKGVKPLKNYDRIGVGDTELVFVAFCVGDAKC